MKTAYLTFALSCMTCLSASASTVYSNNFGTDVVGSPDSAFSGGTVTQAPSGEIFLAGFGPGGSTTLTLSGSYTNVTVSFTLDAVGSLDGGPGNGIPGGGPGDYFAVGYSSGSGSGTLFDDTFANYGNGETQTYPIAGSAPGAGATAINALQYGGFPQGSGGSQDAEYSIVLTLPSISGTTSFTFTDDSNEGANNEFYGIDNVVVSGTGVTSVAATPEPASLTLLSLGLGAVSALRYRRRR